MADKDWVSGFLAMDGKTILMESEALLLPKFYFTKNGKPVALCVHIDDEKGERWDIYKVEATWEGDPGMDPEKLYEDIKKLEESQ